MGSREQLVQRWQEGLDRYEDEMRRASPHRRWLKRIYIRVYRFLLSVYGGGNWTADAGASEVADTGPAADEVGSPRGQLIDLRADEEGRPPKGVAEIRHTLKTVHGAARSPELGPQTHGLDPDDWIVAASQRDGADAQRCALALRRRGIPCRLSGWLLKNAVVEVPYVHHEEALAVLNELGSGVRLKKPCDLPRLPWPTSRRMLLGAWFAAIFGGICPLVATFCTEEPQPDRKIGQVVVGFLACALLSAAIGAWLGWLCGGRDQ